MENLDELMRQKFASDDPVERFEFREEYWEQAQVLIERDEARRRWRLWLFIGLLVALDLLVWFLAVQHPGGISQNNQKPHSTLGKAQWDAPLSGHTQKLEPDNQKNPVPDKFHPKEIGKMEAPKPATKSNMPLMHLAATKEGLAAKTNDNPATETRQQRPSALTDRAGEREGEKNLQLEAGQPENAKPNDLVLTTEASSWASIPIAFLPTPLRPLTMPAPRPHAPPTVPTWAKEPIAKNIKPIENQRFSLGLTLAGSANQTDTSGRWAGWALGVFGNYRLNKHWSLSLGGQWRFLPGHSAFTQAPDSENPGHVAQLRYSFGFQRKEWNAETRGLHYLELPVSARWGHGRWGLDAGVAAGALLLVQNRTEYTEESSLEAAKTVVDRTVKGNAAPYNPGYVAAFAGGEYWLSNRFSVTARGQYRFTAVVKSLGEGVKNSGLGNVELGLRVRLF